MPKYATNHLMAKTGPFIRGRTHHKVRERSGRLVTAQCGATFTVEEHQLTDDDDDLHDRHKCGRCFDD